MEIFLKEPSNFHYIYINNQTNCVHLLVPFIAGVDVSTDNTCKSDLELKAFFEGGAFNELASYKSTLEFHISLLEKGDAHYKAKKERLTQINTYFKAVVGMRDSYQNVVNTFLSKPSNLYSIQLRPRVQDPMSRVVNPVFTINRGNDNRGTPLSPLYNKMHEVFPRVVLGKPDPRTDLIHHVLKILPRDATFDDIKHALKSQCTEQFKIDIDIESWIRPIPGRKGVKEPVDKASIDTFMGFNENDNVSSKDYIDALLGVTCPNLWGMIPGSPFYLRIYGNTAHQTESLSMMTQFYLGSFNVYCRAKGISNKNFGMILDGSPALSHELVEILALALSRGGEVEPAIVTFFNLHKNEFKLSRELSSRDKDAIVKKFETTYRRVTATKENPHMDDFMFLDTEAFGENDIYITHKGLICTDASNIIPTTPQNKDYLAKVRHEARMHQGIVTPQDKPVIKIDIAPEALVEKLSDEWARLPVDVADACRALPAFKVRELLDDVAKGKQNEAHTLLESSEDKQTLLRIPGKFIDYSGRIFHCTAYEYAYWAKDKHMMDMLTNHMDAETKAFMSERVDAMEHSGLTYQQHGVSYQNAHYDMSFVLKNLTINKFRQLQRMTGQSNSKIQQATADNYKNTSFTATEYESLKKNLEQHRPNGIFSFFYSSPATALSGKLQFDFHSLITALDTYVTNYYKWDSHQQLEAWMKVGKAQRDVPAHIAHEYCRLDRSFDPLPSFNEENLPRILTFDNYTGTPSKSWFPLSSSSSGLGFAFALIRSHGPESGDGARSHRLACFQGAAAMDLAAARHLDEVRIVDLTLARENLRPAANQQGFAH